MFSITGRPGNGDEAGIHVFGNVGAVIAENTVLNNAVFDLWDEGECGANTWRRKLLSGICVGAFNEK